MRLRTLWLNDFRSYHSTELELPDGLVVLEGPNGVGKTNLLEAIAWIALVKSFRRSPPEAMVATGARSAVIRAEVEHEGRVTLVEAELSPGGRNRVQVNRQRLRRGSDLLGVLRVTVFAPEDLEIVKSGPSLRRELLDDLAVALDPRRSDTQRTWDRALRQRNALLKQAHGRLDESGEVTLGVWNQQLSAAGGELVEAREELVAQLSGRVESAYRHLSGTDEVLRIDYRRSWEGDLLAAFEAVRSDELRRGVTLVGPHRDDVVITLDGRPTRTHASQGEQRCVALSLRLAAHRALTDALGSPPLLLLDDVFSELDPARSRALLEALPATQTILTTAVPAPTAMLPTLTLDVVPGGLRPREQADR